jgi:hypothetical protein
MILTSIQTTDIIQNYFSPKYINHLVKIAAINFLNQNYNYE